MIPAAFRRVLGRPGAPRLVATSLVGRLPITFTSLATVLLVREHSGSFATAGIVAGAEALGAGVATPWQGRLIDRHSQPRVLVPLALVNASGLLLLAGAAVAGAPTLVLVVCGLVAGAGMPPIGACIRTLWSTLLDEDELDTAYSLESILTEVMFITGPLLATAIFALASPAAALVFAAVLVVAGTLGFATARASRSWRSDAHSRPSGWAISASGMRTVAGVAVAMGTAFGAVEVALAAFARAHGSAAAAGALVAAMAAGSMIGGLWYGTRSWQGSVATRAVVFYSLLAASLALLVVASSLAAMAALSFVAGLPIAPAGACLYRLTGDVAPQGMLAESFTWLSTSVVAGAAAGSAVAGPVVQHVGMRAALAVPCAAACVGALVLLAGRASLAPREDFVSGAV